jgi:hypothetical protein
MDSRRRIRPSSDKARFQQRPYYLLALLVAMYRMAATISLYCQPNSSEDSNAQPCRHGDCGRSGAASGARITVAGTRPAGAALGAR